MRKPQQNPQLDVSIVSGLDSEPGVNVLGHVVEENKLEQEEWNRKPEEEEVNVEEETEKEGGVIKSHALSELPQLRDLWQLQEEVLQGALQLQGELQHKELQEDQAQLKKLHQIQQLKNL